MDTSLHCSAQQAISPEAHQYFNRQAQAHVQFMPTPVPAPPARLSSGLNQTQALGNLAMPSFKQSVLDFIDTEQHAHNLVMLQQMLDDQSPPIDQLAQLKPAAEVPTPRTALPDQVGISIRRMSTVSDQAMLPNKPMIADRRCGNPTTTSHAFDRPWPDDGLGVLLADGDDGLDVLLADGDEGLDSLFDNSSDELDAMIANFASTEDNATTNTKQVQTSPAAHMQTQALGSTPSVLVQPDANPLKRPRYEALESLDNTEPTISVSSTLLKQVLVEVQATVAQNRQLSKKNDQLQQELKTVGEQAIRAVKICSFFKQITLDQRQLIQAMRATITRAETPPAQNQS